MKIVKAPNQVLANKTQKVASFDIELKKMVDSMVQTMRQSNGIGLAANQIGKDMSVMIIEMNAEKIRIPITIVVNPKLISQGSELETEIEGCLSLPGLEVEVPRSTAVKIKGQNLKGKPITIAAKGMFARIIQHEFDHLNGYLITDRGEKISNETKN